MEVSELYNFIKPVFLGKVLIMVDGGVGYHNYLGAEPVDEYLLTAQIIDVYVNTNRDLQVNVEKLED